MKHIALIPHPFRPAPEPRLYFWMNGIVWDYRVVSTNFLNSFFDKEYNIVETHSIRLGFERALFERDPKSSYDGHTTEGFTFLGINVAWSYTYDSRPITEKEVLQCAPLSK